MSRPNVVWIMDDQHNYRALGCADRLPIETPNLDALAERGMRFADTYCPAPVCGPSRASLFTGQYPQSHEFTGNNATFREGVDLLPELLSEAGYHTALVGKLHFTPKAAPHGFEYRRPHDCMYDYYHLEEPWNSEYVAWLANERFDGDVRAVIERANEDEAAFRDRGNMYRFLLGTDWRSETDHSNTWVAEESIRYLRERSTEPFFLFTSFFGPHQPMRAPGEWAEMYDPDDVELPPEFEIDPAEKPVGRVRTARGDTFRYFDRADWPRERYREVLAAYYGQVSMIDDRIGRLLEELDRQGLRDDTIVVFTSDHGDHSSHFGWFEKGSMYESAARVPLIVDDPAYPDTSGETTTHVVNNLGLFRTILARCGIDTDNGLPSRDLRPLLQAPHRDDWRDETYSELTDFWMFVRDGYKLIRARALDGDFVHELYDRTTTPIDDPNLWDTPSLQHRQEELWEALVRRQEGRWPGGAD